MYWQQDRYMWAMIMFMGIHSTLYNLYIVFIVLLMTRLYINVELP